MTAAATILVVDDTPKNVTMLADILTFKGYGVVTACGGKEALAKLESERPDLVLLDVMMPDLNGYEVCRAIRANPATEMLPVVMVTALDPASERVKGIEAGADDFLSKPILAGDVEDPLQTHRREITVVFTDLRGFTAFSDSAEPEEVMSVLRDYHGTLGRAVVAHAGTIEHFAGDGVMILFNDPLPVAEHEFAAVRMAVDMRTEVTKLAADWSRRGHDLAFGVGVANGFATLGTIGFEGRRDYGAIGPVCNLAARLCSEARAGQILVSKRVHGRIEQHVVAEPLGELALKGFHRNVQAFNVTGLKPA